MGTGTLDAAGLKRPRFMTVIPIKFVWLGFVLYIAPVGEKPQLWRGGNLKDIVGHVNAFPILGKLKRQLFRHRAFDTKWLLTYVLSISG